MVPDSWAETCLRCGSAMVEGVLVDTTYGSHIVGRWMAGPVEESKWSGLKVKGQQRLPVVAFRCQSCGRLELYAPDLDV